MKMYTLIVIVTWLAILAISDGSDRVTAKTFGCQLLPVVKKFRSQNYEHCTLTIPAFTCGGYCESSVEPFKVKKKKENDVYEITLKEDCSCCTPVTNRTYVPVIDEWGLDCKDGIARNESVTLQLVERCSCTKCRSSNKVG